MKAIVYARYRQPEALQLKDVAKPVPKDDEALIKTYATTVTSGDWRLRTLDVPRGFGARFTNAVYRGKLGATLRAFSDTAR